jgi:hypothetical protein
MMSARRFPHVALLGLALGVCAPAQRGPADDPPAGTDPWTFNEAVSRLVLSPHDAYLQYVVLQLGRRGGREQEAVAAVEGRRPAWLDLLGGDRGRRARADLFATFTGALAIQESLQLDTMRGDQPDQPPRPQPPGTPLPRPKPKEPKESVPIGKLTGPSVPSHPWEKLLGAKKPDVGPLAALVPDDYYFAEFRSVTKLHEVLGAGGLWGGHIFTQALGDARSGQTAERVKAQLGLLGLSPETLDKLGVEAVAVVGSDPFISEGSDVTLLVKGRNIAALAKLVEGSGGKAESGEHVGIKYTHRFTPDGKVNAFAASPAPDLHVRGNSLPAFRRVLETVAGKQADGKPVKRLGESAEFRYVRSLMPRGAGEEDGFVYLSDAFVRRLVGPQLKITERRRVIAYTHLRMIGHAALMFRTEHGRPPRSLQELADTKCAPGVFGQGDLAHPDGGTYSLTPDGMSGVCSRFGKAEALTPCAERLVTEATGEEVEAYKQFVADYSQYWRTFFDQIAVRVGVTEKQLRLETLVLPLIDNSIYADLARGAGKPVALDLLPTPRREIGGVWLHFDKQPLVDALGPAGAAKQDAGGGGAKPPVQIQNDLKQIGLAMHNYHDANGHLPTTNIRDANGTALLSWRVAILPYVEQEALYKEFKLDEPWDSPHNKKLIEKMPPLFAGNDAALNRAGKTTYLLPSGKGTLSPPEGGKLTIGGIADGSSNTILVVVADPARAVVWTKPDDLPFDPKDPLKGMVRPGQNTIAVVMADGSTRHLPTSTDPKTVAALVTPAGGETVELVGNADPADDVFSWRLLREILPGASDVRNLEQAGVDLNKLRRFVKDGIGDQVGLHMHDAPRLLDSDYSGLLGGSGSEMALGTAGLLLKFVFGPSSVSIPVKDAKVVDEFLDELDRLLLAARQDVAGLGVRWRKEADFYRFPVANGHTARCVVVNLFGLKWRVYWARIGDGLYVVTRPFILDDLAAAHSDGKRPAKTEAAHAALRVRPENWNAVWAGYNLGWAEGNRAACHANLDMVANVSRGWNDRAAAADDPTLLGRVTRVYGARPFCPEGGTYSLGADGRSCRCSVHGGHDDPRQPAAPTDASATGKLMKTFSGMTAVIRFEDDGLRVVVTVDRTK